jgi:DNA-directed RNA polymerase subunit RPC12/RpoP
MQMQSQAPIQQSHAADGRWACTHCGVHEHHPSVYAPVICLNCGQRRFSWFPLKRAQK